MNEPVIVPPAHRVEMRRKKDGRVRPTVVAESRLAAHAVPVSVPVCRVRLSAKETAQVADWMAPCGGQVSGLVVRCDFQDGVKLLAQAEANSVGGGYFDLVGGLNTVEDEMRVESGDVLALRVTALENVTADIRAAFLFSAEG